MWEELLARYGHRGLFESDIATPRYRENPQAMIRILLDGTTALTPVRHTVAGLLAWPVWWVLSRAMYRRDALRSAGMRVYERVRRILMKRAHQAVKEWLFDACRCNMAS
jgi:pyruvate,water dikinase